MIADSLTCPSCGTGGGGHLVTCPRLCNCCGGLDGSHAKDCPVATDPALFQNMKQEIAAQLSANEAAAEAAAADTIEKT